MRRPALSILAVALSTACGPDTTNLEPLNQELAQTSYEQAIANKIHFAPLCDQNGYPLCGNIVSKGGGGTSGTTASRFCASLRQK